MIEVGLGDIAAITRQMTATFAEMTPPFSFSVSFGVLDEYRTEPEIAQRLDAYLQIEPTGQAS